MKYRIEKDTLGEVEVPADVYYGPQTQRSVNNFKIATDISRMPEEVIGVRLLEKRSGFG